MRERNTFQGNYIAVTVIFIPGFDKLLQDKKLWKQLYKQPNKICQINLSRRHQLCKFYLQI